MVVLLVSVLYGLGTGMCFKGMLLTTIETYYGGNLGSNMYAVLWQKLETCHTVPNLLRCSKDSMEIFHYSLSTCLVSDCTVTLGDKWYLYR